MSEAPAGKYHIAFKSAELCCAVLTMSYVVPDIYIHKHGQVLQTDARIGLAKAEYIFDNFVWVCYPFTRSSTPLLSSMQKTFHDVICMFPQNLGEAPNMYCKNEHVPAKQPDVGIVVDWQAACQGCWLSL